jgi:hypothetical protein
MSSLFAAPLATLMLFSACQLPSLPPACNTQIDWINFVQVQSTQYVAGPGAPAIVQESELGAVYMRVNSKLSGHVCDPSYRPKDGDAAFLDVGTPVYQLNAHPPAEGLAAHFNGQLGSLHPRRRSRDSVGPAEQPTSGAPRAAQPCVPTKILAKALVTGQWPSCPPLAPATANFAGSLSKFPLQAAEQK